MKTIDTEIEKIKKLQRAGDWAKAETGYLDLLKKYANDPTILPALLNSLGTLYFTSGKLDQAIHAYQSAIEKQPGYLDAYYNLGLAFSKQQQFDKAITTYETILEFSPDYLFARFQLAISLAHKGQTDKAITQLLFIEQHSPDHLETQTNLGTFYLKKSDLAKAKSHYLKALILAPQDTQILFNLGVIHAQLGHLDQAIQYYQQVVRIQPEHFPAHNNLGVAFLAKNHTVFALQHFQTALRLQPHNEAIRHTVQALSNNQQLSSTAPDYITALFDAYADHYEPHLLSALNYQVPPMLYQAIQQCVAPPKQEWFILDIGCGTGLCGELFKPAAKKLIGIDLSNKMLDIAKQKNIYDELIVGDFNQYLATHENKFNLIVAGDVLVYLGDLQDTFKNVHHALTKKGLFVFNTETKEQPDPGFVITQSGRFIHHKNYIKQLAAEHQLKILHYQTAITRQQNNEAVIGHIFVLQS